MLIGTCILVLALAYTARILADDLQDNRTYQLGRGFRFPALNLTLSGYASARVRNLENENTRFDLRDLSLFTSWNPEPRWRVFSEIEFEDFISIDEAGINNSDTKIIIERLYADFAFSTHVNVRAGRFLTPFGRWNLVHADPLVWTVTRPLVTSLPVADHATGAAIFGALPLSRGVVEYIAYADDSDALNPNNGEADFEDLSIPGLPNDFDHGAGGQLRYRFFGERAQVGVSYAAFEMFGSDDLDHAFGVDALLKWKGMEISSEAAYRINSSGSRRDDWGAFAQAVVPVAARLFAFGRAEFFSSGILGREAGRASVGLAYRPTPPLTLKFEYDNGGDNLLAPDGWQISCGILF